MEKHGQNITLHIFPVRSSMLTQSLRFWCVCWIFVLSSKGFHKYYIEYSTNRFMIHFTERIMRS